MMAKNKVDIFEVGPRDGLQNEKKTLTTAQKMDFVRGLAKAGVRNIELGAFVRPDKIPQMADTDALYEKIRSGELDLGKAKAWSLIPNRKGLERALKVGATHLAIFTAATDSFAKANIGMTIDESFTEYKEVISALKKAGMRKKVQVRGYISTAFGCPFDGKVAPKKALKVVERLLDLGVDQISIGDTIGVATPLDVEAVVKPAYKTLGKKMLALHFHDTRGTALANALRAYELGARIFDSSAGGLGGCPYAPGATGNLATEDLLYMFNGMGIEHGIDLDQICKLSLDLSAKMGRPISSRYLASFAAKC